MPRVTSLMYCTLLITFLLGSLAIATTDTSESRVFAVQRRPSFYAEELTLQAGYLPLDSFNRYISVGGSYTHRFSAFSAWEVVNAFKGFNSTSGLTEQIQRAYNVSPQTFNTLDYQITTNYIYTPFYSKNLFLGKSIVPGETSIAVGGGQAKFDVGFSPCADFGLIFKYAVGEANTLNFDFRYIFYFSPDAKNNLAMSVTYSIPFGQKEERGQANAD